MNEITLRITSSQNPIDPQFIQFLEKYIKQHGCRVEEIGSSTPLPKPLTQESPKPTPTRSLLTDWRLRLEKFREEADREFTSRL